MRYDATSEIIAGEWYATVQAARPASEALALRHASAVRAVLLAVRAWAKARGLLERWPSPRRRCRFADAERRLYAAQERLAQIEKEVTRG